MSNQDRTRPLILTLKLVDDSLAMLDGLRKAHFPPERNLIPAHVTMIHALPGQEQDAIMNTLREVCAATPEMAVSFPALRFLGRGVAIEVHCPELSALRKRLARAWRPWLNNQDKAGYKPHATIQNKVQAHKAKMLHAAMRTTWEPVEGRGLGLLLWRYLGGPWEPVETFDFAAGK
jgi:2'-5' RNA ligase